MKLQLVMSILIFLAYNTTAQQLVYSHKMDTTIYDNFKSYVFSEPQIETGVNLTAVSNRMPGMPFFTYRKKGTNQVDVFSFLGKIGQFTLVDNYDNIYCRSILVSRKFIDIDDGWECIYNIIDATNQSLFKVVDDNGQTLLSDSGNGLYGFDGSSTYVFNEGFGLNFTASQNQETFKVWRFRNDVNSANPNLSKKTFTTNSQFYMFGPSTDNFYLRINPTNSNDFSIQLFDLLGRLIYTHNLDNVTTPITISIPENKTPNSAIIAKIKGNSGSTSSRVLPIR